MIERDLFVSIESIQDIMFLLGAPLNSDTQSAEHQLRIVPLS